MAALLPLDQKALLKSISKHLDSLAASIKWAILFSVTLWWAGLQKQDPIETLGVEVAKQHAFVLGSIAYSAVNAAVLMKLLRLADLMRLVHDESLIDAVTRLATHSWELNPFAYFGPSIFTRTHSCLGVGGLIAVWWMCNSSLYALKPASGLLEFLLLGVFLVIGLASLVTIQTICKRVLARTKDSQPELHSLFAATEKERSIFAFVGIFIGGAVAFVTNLVAISWL